MSDYYIITGLDFPDTSASYASSSTCTSPTSIDSGSYDSACAGTMLSGHTCTPTCDSGHALSGITICIGGTLTEATCTATSTTSSPTVSQTASPTASPTTAPTAASSASTNWTLFKYDMYLCFALGAVLLLA